ncbi:hypothetical protein E4U54_004610 [Claviceps lovelessii]|nr:hypothetical protein E4U54_004610 [Claviceps lovelessii]
MSSSAKCPSQDAATAIALKRETVLVDLRDAPLESQPQRNKQLSKFQSRLHDSRLGRTSPLKPSDT